MRCKGRIIVRGVVQGVGFRPFVYAAAEDLGISGRVTNLGSEVEIYAYGDNFEKFLERVSHGTPLSEIDSIEVLDAPERAAPGSFTIAESADGSLTGFIPADVAICDECVNDLYQPEGRYRNYWATSCVNCGPRYSIIRTLPYDRERTSMDVFPMCAECRREYTDPGCRRHHAQTIACASCGPGLQILDPHGNTVECVDPIRGAAELLDRGAIVAIRGTGGFHIACTEGSVDDLKRRLGRTEQPLAVMIHPDVIDTIAVVTDEERQALESRVCPIVVLEKQDHLAHMEISNLHTIGCMLPYTGLHHLLFHHLSEPLLVMTSANIPGYPMITDIDHAMAHLKDCVDYFLTHDRVIVNRIDDSVVRDGYIIRLSRGLSPRRVPIDLGSACILGVGPERNSNITIYRNGFCITSPHIGNIRNPATLAYLEETVETIGSLIGAGYDVIAHDAHPQFLSTRYAASLADECGAALVEVQHHRAHIAATTQDECIGIAIDGVGYGDDGAVWGGEVFAGETTDLRRVAHLEYHLMPGGDLATEFPERMLYAILPTEGIRGLLASRGWGDTELGVLERQVERRFNATWTSSTGRVLDAASAMLGICGRRTYDGEPAMRLEARAASGRAVPWDLEFMSDGGCEVLSTRALCREALRRYERVQALHPDEAYHAINSIAASFQYNLARGISALAIHAAEDRGIPRVALSGGIVYNHTIRETIREEIMKAGLEVVINRACPPGDGGISYGQCIYAGALLRER